MNIWRVGIVLLILLSLVAGVNATITTINASKTHHLWTYDNQSWYWFRDQASSEYSSNSTAIAIEEISAQRYGSGLYSADYRAALTWDTSGLPDDAVITDAVIRVYRQNVWTSLGSPNYTLIDFTPTDPLAPGVTDYNKTTFTPCTDYLESSAFNVSTNTSINFTLNAAGLSAINTTGYTSFMGANNWTVTNTSPTWSSWKYSNAAIQGLAFDNGRWTPQLIINYTGGSLPVSSFTNTTSTGIYPFNYSVTDTTTNSPIQWNYSWGDGTWTNGTQNPSHVYGTGGIYDVYLIATNVIGSDESDHSTVWVRNQTTADFTATEYTFSVPPSKTIYFNASPSINETYYNWKIEGSWSNGTDINVSHEYTAGVTDDVVLVTNDTGYGESTKTRTVTVTQIYAPTSAFTCFPLEGEVSLSVTCTDTSTNTPTAWTWYNNTTQVSTDQNPTFSIATVGLQDIKLYAENDAGGDWENKSEYVNVTVAAGTEFVLDVNATYCGQPGRLADSTFANIRTSTGDTMYHGTAVGFDMQAKATNSSPYWDYYYRGGCKWDASAIPDDATITGATLTGYSRYRVANLGNPTMAWINFSPATPAGPWVAGDYDNLEYTRYTDSRPYSEFTTLNASITWTLTTEGINNISKTTYTTMYLEPNWTIDNQEPTWSTSKEGAAQVANTSYAGGAFSPKLSITYTTGGVTPTASFTKNQTVGIYPLYVGLSDTSTGGATYWNWSWGDGTWTNGTNAFPSKVYATGGIYSVYLICNNSYGEDTSDAQTITVRNQTLAMITKNKTVIKIGSGISLNSSSFNATNWSWNYGDNTTLGTTENTSHRYKRPGIFNVTLTTNDTTYGENTNYTKVWSVTGGEEPRYGMPVFDGTEVNCEKGTWTVNRIISDLEVALTEVKMMYACDTAR